MPDITISGINDNLLGRLRQIATERRCSLDDLVLHLLAHAVEMYDTAKSPEEIQSHVESFKPKSPRPVIDRERIQAMVDGHKRTPGEEP